VSVEIIFLPENIRTQRSPTDEHAMFTLID
jgi:hypothetical protein